jgi:hypothetical protein
MVSRVALYSPRVALEQLRGRFRGTLAAEVDERGWYHVPEGTSYELTPAGAAEVLARHHGFMRPAYLAGNEATLQHLVSLLRQHDVEVIVLTMPLWRTYRAGMRPELWERTREVLGRLSGERGVRVLSFQDDPRLAAEDFMDCDHLNAHGAARFTALLAEALGPPGGGPPAEESGAPVPASTTSAAAAAISPQRPAQ